MHAVRRALILLPLLALSAACSGPNSRLITLKPGTGSREVSFALRNAGQSPINSLFLARTEAVNAADPDRLDPESPAGEQLWGADLVQGSAIAQGESRVFSVAGPGRWNARAVDRDGRQQHVAGLRLDAGGRYVLELHDSGWRMR